MKKNNLKEIYEVLEIENIEFYDELQASTNIYCSGTAFLQQLLLLDEYPLKNKRIAIKNIMNFLSYVDELVRIEGTTLVPIGKDVLVKHFTNDRYIAYVDLLKKMNVMTAVPYENGAFYNYIEKRLTKQFRIHNQYLKQNLAILLIDDKTEIKLNFDGKFHKKFTATIAKIEVDMKGAIEAEIKAKKSNNSLRCRLSALLRLNRIRWARKGQKVDRIYHSLSNLSKVSREFIHVNGERFHNIDIKNCQPLLLCYLLLQNGLDVDPSYMTDCENGRLYEKFINQNSTKSNQDYKKEREEIKVSLYKSIYFDFKPKRKVSQNFKLLYPKTYRSLEIISKDAVKMATKLQNLEASIFNSLVPKKSKYFFTLFDAIYFTDENDQISLRHDIDRKFKMFNIKPCLSINGN